MMDDFRVLSQADPPSERFTWEIVRSLAESVRTMQQGHSAMLEKQTEILERLVRIESGKTHEAVERIVTRLAVLETRAATEDGVAAGRAGFLKWWGPITWTAGIIFTVFFLLFRATGVIHLPSDPPPVVTPRESSEQRDGRPIQH